MPLYAVMLLMIFAVVVHVIVLRWLPLRQLLLMFFFFAPCPLMLALRYADEFAAMPLLRIDCCC